ncbi:MAG: carboxypeptidase regulatory-like domain-containing protein [Planctomycetes bacterium]|nr:carboxypeptidase regulatory-like domain-containing protein [Planctomycetota bacterium]
MERTWTPRGLALLAVLGALVALAAVLASVERGKSAASSLAEGGARASEEAPLAAPERALATRASAETAATTTTRVAPSAAELAALFPAPRVERMQVFGRVVDERGAPIEGAELCACGWGSGQTTPPVLVCRSLADGTLAGECEKGAGFQEFLVFAAGHAAVEMRTRPGVREALQLGTIVLADGGDIAGLVVDESGRLVAGATVAAYPGESFPKDADAARAGEFDVHERTPVFFSEANGRFRIPGAPFGPRFVVVQATPGSPFGWSELFELTAVVPEIRVVAPSRKLGSRWIGGVVRAPDGTPLEGATLSAWSGELRCWATCSADGSFTLEQDWQRSVDLVAFDPKQRYAPLKVEGLAPGARDVEVRLGEPDWVRIVLRDTEKRPAPWGHAKGLKDGRDARNIFPPLDANAEGVLWIQRPLERFGVETRAPGFVTQTFGPFEPYELGDELVLTLERGQALRGRVTCAGVPVAGATLALGSANEQGKWHEAHGVAPAEQPWTFLGTISFGAADGTSDANGEFVLGVARAGWQNVRIDAAGFPTTVRGPFELTQAGFDGLELELEHGGALKGRVLLPPGAAPRERLVAVSDGWGYAHTVPVDAGGGYGFDDLAPGPYQVRPSAPPAGARERLWGGDERAEPLAWDCTVRAGETTRFDLDLTQEGSCVLVGRFAFGAEDPRDWTARLTEPESGALRAYVELERDGRFRLALSRPGRYALELTAGGHSFSTEVELAVGETAWSLERQSCTLRVHPPDAPPTDERGRPTSHGFLRFVQDGRPSFCAAISLLAFENDWLVNVPAGRGRLELSAGEDEPWRLLDELDIRAGEETLCTLPADAF